MNHKISIITPTYNSSLFVRYTIEAILRQTYSNWELLITDDCSSDNTCQIIEEFCKKDVRIKLFRLNANLGGGVARNNSIKYAIGRYIAFCDSDDVWHPEKLERQISFMKRYNLAFTFSSYQKMNEKGERGAIISAPETITYDDLLKTCSIGCLTAIYDTKTLGKVYMPEIRKRQDYGLWLKIMKEIGETKGTKDVLAYYRERSNSVSSNKLEAARYHFRILREVAHVPFLKSIYYFGFYAFAGLIKYLK